jgi:hypothetical protein
MYTPSKCLTTTVRIQRKTIKFAKKFLAEDEVSLSRFVELSLRKYIENKTGQTFKSLFENEEKQNLVKNKK